MATATLESQPHRGGEGAPAASGARRYMQQPGLLSQRLAPDARAGAGGRGAAGAAVGGSVAAVSAGADWGAGALEGAAAAAAGEAGSPGQRPLQQPQQPPKSAGRQPTLPTVVSGVQLDATYDAITHFSGLSREWARTALEQAPRYLILDFR